MQYSLPTPTLLDALILSTTLHKNVVRKKRLKICRNRFFFWVVTICKLTDGNQRSGCNNVPTFKAE